MKTTTENLDGGQLAILASRLDGVARKMSNTLARTGRSGVLNRAKDFSCCIVTAEGDLLTSAESLPIHVLSGPDLMAKSMLDLHPMLKPGDAFIHNSPYHGCSHAADQTIIVPVFDDNQQHRLTVLAKAHQADIGNSQPTTYMGDATDVYNEGALIFPCVKIQQDYRDIGDIVRMCQMRIRVPEQWHGDYLAAVGAARIGERELMKLFGSLGWDTVDQFAQEWFDYAENRMAAAIRSLPAGIVTARSTHDPFPGTPDDGVMVETTLHVDPKAAQITVDLRNNPDCMQNGLNLSEACSRTSALVGVFNSIDHSIPKNAGSFRRVNVLLRENCIVGIPRHPTSCSAATTNIADRVANSVQCAFADIQDGSGMAEVGAVIAPATGVVSGKDPRSDRDFVNQIFLGMTGGAASPQADAWLTIGHVGNAGMCCIDGIELDELYHPFIVDKRELLPDTEGAGRTVGAWSIEVRFGPTSAPIEVGYLSDGHHNPAAGVRGGLAGGKADQHIERVDGHIDPLDPCALISLQPGERVISVGAGGGGYGAPCERSPEMVAEMVAEGLVSVERASTVYSVALTETMTVDRQKTDVLRAGTADTGQPKG